MRVACLLHAEHEDTGCIEPWLRHRGHAVSLLHLYRGEALPSPAEFDWLVVMGGPMNIYEHERHPWLVPEKALIGQAVREGRRVLGVCLGAQLLADALGSRVTRNAHSEIGWFDVTRVADGAAPFAGFPERFAAFHWHGDTFSIPPGGQHLMASEACAHQAYALGDRVAGIQFHLEVTAANARDWLKLEPTVPARYVQSGEEILSDVERFAGNNRLMFRLLENLEAG